MVLDLPRDQGAEDGDAVDLDQVRGPFGTFLTEQADMGIPRYGAAVQRRQTTGGLTRRAAEPSGRGNEPQRNVLGGRDRTRDLLLGAHDLVALAAEIPDGSRPDVDERVNGKTRKIVMPSTRCALKIGCTSAT
jgi:hypothetical protein